MFSVGTDLVEIQRIKKSVESEHFLKKVYGEKELEYFKNKKNWVESAAAFFAAKEAFGKATGRGIVGFSLNEVQVIHDAFGKPSLFLSGKALKVCDKNRFELSLSHTQNYATAVVIAWKEASL